MSEVFSILIAVFRFNFKGCFDDTCQTAADRGLKLANRSQIQFAGCPRKSIFRDNPGQCSI